MWDWHKDGHKDQWNCIESPDINPYIYGQIIFDVVAKTINGERTASSTNGYPHAKNEAGPLPYTIHKN